MTDEEIIAVVQAHKEGKIVEFRFIHGSDKQWRFCGYGPFQWNLDQHEYRIAPESPKEVWLDFKNGGKSAEVYEFNYCGDCVLFREVKGASSGEPTMISSTVKTFNQTQPEPRKPRVLDLVYEGGGTWKELYPISIGMIGESVRFREVLEDRECNCGFPDQHHSVEHYPYCNSLK